MPFQPLAEPVRPADVFDGGSVDIQSLVPEAHQI